MDVTDTYRTFHPKTTGYTFFSSAHGTFSKIDMLGHKTSLNKFKRIEIISSIFSDHNDMKLEINYMKKTGKFTNMWRLNSMLLNNQHIEEEIKREIFLKLETNENGNVIYQNLWDAAKAVLRGKFIVINAYLKKQKKFQVSNLTLHLKELEKKQIKPKVTRRKEITKIRAEISEIDTKKTIKKSTKLRSGSLRR